MCEKSKIRFFEDILAQSFKTEKVNTVTSTEQTEVENVILRLFKHFEKAAAADPDLPLLKRDLHIKLLKEQLIELPQSYECLDASRPWLVYWILNSLWILGDMPDSKTLSHVVYFLSKCQHPSGGYCGGPGQMPHLAPTYAAVNALSIIGTDEAYDSINRSKLQNFLWSVRQVDGSFALHRGGERDVRGVYCAVSVAKLTNVYSELLFDKTADWVVSCQTYEGGFGGCPGMEAHGGYAFCGIASLALMNKTDLCDIDSLLRWCVNRQMRLEGGFQGRTNKLVDGCYSFWQGAIFPVLNVVLAKTEENPDILDSLLFDQGALQEYILICCQHHNGGLVDKPGKPRDIYHTCYTLSGLSVAQHGSGVSEPFVIGSHTNEVNRVHPLHNIAPHHVYNAVHYFIRHPPPVDD